MRPWVVLGGRQAALWKGRMAPLLIALHYGLLALEVLQEEDLIDEDDIPVRSFFPENWLWTLEKVDRIRQ